MKPNPKSSSLFDLGFDFFNEYQSKSIGNPLMGGKKTKGHDHQGLISQGEKIRGMAKKNPREWEIRGNPI